MKVGDKVIHIEKIFNGESFEYYEWDAEITRVKDAYVEVCWRRNFVTHPQWRKYNRAYEKTWTKHYGELKYIKY